MFKAGPSTARSVHAATAAFIDEMEAAGQQPRGAGIATSVVRGGEVVYQGAFGLRDRERALPVTTKTLFEVGSFTKAFTATAFLTACAEHSVDLHARIRQRSSVLELHTREVSEQLSIADLLSHRTGLPSHDLLWALMPYETRELSTRLRHLELVPGAFRKTFIYNNLIYAASSTLFADLFGERLDSYVDRRLFQRIEMKTTSLTASPVSDDQAEPYVGMTRTARRQTQAIFSAGGLRSNLEDLTRWLALHLRRGRSESGVELFPPTMLDNTYESHIVLDNAGPLLFRGLEWLETRGYGLGWFVASAAGHEALHHPSLLDGFTCAVVLMPGLDLGFLVLTNTNLSSIPGELIRRQLELMLGTSLVGPSGGQFELPRVPASAPGPNDAFSSAGLYENPAYGRLEVAPGPGGPSLRLGGHEWSVSLQNTEEGAFEIDVFGVHLPMPIRFDKAGERTERVLIPLSMDPRVPPQVFSRVE